MSPNTTAPWQRRCMREDNLKNGRKHVRFLALECPQVSYNDTVKRDELRRSKVSEIEENLANQAESILGFKPSSEIKRGPTGILISIICIAIVYRELSLAGVV